MDSPPRARPANELLRFETVAGCSSGETTGFVVFEVVRDGDAIGVVVAADIGGLGARATGGGGEAGLEDSSV